LAREAADALAEAGLGDRTAILTEAARFTVARKS
jgi:hypothetical protein